MLNRALIAVCLGMSLVSCAGSPAAPGTAKSTVAAAAAPTGPVGCVSPGGTTPAPAPAPNCSAPGTVYSRTDIDRTGQPTVGAALQNLSPALTVHGNP